MRTPLGAIVGFAQLMDACSPPPTVLQKRRIDLILQAGWHLEKLINMTRDLALLQSGALSLSLDPVPLAAVMLDCQAMIEPQAQMRGIRVTFPRLETPCLVLADGIRLQQVLGNLLSAAIEYSEVDGAIVVDCDTGSSDCVRIGIHDDGEGLFARRAMRISQPPKAFEHGSTALQGTGIGLPLAKRLVESMGGVIGAESNVGTGKIFSFDLKRWLMPSRGKKYDV